jgi:hypothetical protein
MFRNWRPDVPVATMSTENTEDSGEDDGFHLSLLESESQVCAYSVSKLKCFKYRSNSTAAHHSNKEKITT